VRELANTDPAAFRRALDCLSVPELEKLLQSWELCAHDGQLAPTGSWLKWLVMAGRGFGKTRCAAEAVCDIAEQPETCAGRIALMGRSVADVRDVMIEGDSGLIAVAERRGYDLVYKPTLRSVIWPHGTVGKTYSADEPSQARGPQHGAGWLDEFAAWPKAKEAFNNINFGLRIGPWPRLIITTTPKPTPEMIRLAADAKSGRRGVVITRGSTADNQRNLNPDAYREFVERYEGTTVGRQEMEGELLELAGSILKQDDIHRNRVKRPPELRRKIVSVDPSAKSGEDTDENGIVVAGTDGDDAYVLDDCTQPCTSSAQEWATAAVMAYRRWDCDAIVVETNQGGDLVTDAIRAIDHRIRVIGVWATKSKRARAEPVGALYERGRVHHVGVFVMLEKQLTSWVPGAQSPDRMDALVHAIAHLLLSDDDLVGPISAYWAA
jgi:phage terminase large subunit-like protein